MGYCSIRHLLFDCNGSLMNLWKLSASVRFHLPSISLEGSEQNRMVTLDSNWHASERYFGCVQQYIC